ncbi:hypothetical protein CN448_14375 [Bacillus cereus]|uniref:YhgE/Pip family protein n=1 Tax=Bacillus cereus TaxID=1396 RepID=UPI000BF89519|nr:YhgE/Pip family protein [Bacillus cereus]PEW68848.1 hypothetical protein CN448_14375 [Bacillus cereus]
MKGNQLLRKEFTEIIKSKKILIPIIAVLFVPILYAGMFLWAFWDPYKQLDDLPVAVVNLDKGAVFDGKPIEVGKGLVDNLKDNKSFKWEFVSEKEAKKGMEGRKYYMLVLIPDDFSSNATTLLKDDPKPLNLEYIPNESLNFLSSQIGGTAIEKIKGEVASTLTKTYAEKMFDSIQDVSKGLADVILLFGLGVEVQSIPYFILFSIITSLAFIALIQCLVTAFGDAGRFIAIITLIMQLTTSAGTFPLELIPKFLQPFNAWLPMTYSVSGLKAVVSSGDFDFMWQNIGMLMIFIVVLSLGTIASLTLMHKRQFKNVAENQSVEA